MALEQITTDMDMDIQVPKKKKLESMKKSTSSNLGPFRNEAEKIAYKKNIEKLYKPGYGEMGYKETPAKDLDAMLEAPSKMRMANNEKSKETTLPEKKINIEVMKKISPAARRSAIMNRNMDERDEKGIMGRMYDKLTGNNN
jgi:hypothetical protein